jgi:hypothetical protein
MTVETDASESVSPEGTESAAAVVTGVVARGPMLHPRLPDGVTARVNEAIPIAQKHLRNHPSCRELFARLGADGVVLLNRTSYYPAGRKQERRHCYGDVHAVTTVGGSAVVLCRSFAHLSDQEAAIILLHEALHFAGQPEYPLDHEAPDARAITRTVMEGCRIR